MADVVHIVNGDSTAQLINTAGIAGDIIVWRDILHDGPVPYLIDQHFNQVRAKFLATMLAEHEQDTGLTAATILAQFEQRLTAMQQLNADQQIILWFEHDLYDQLQLLQVLDFMSQQAVCYQAKLVSINQHPSVTFFHGFGDLTADTLSALLTHATPITAKHYSFAQAAWQIVAADNPPQLVELLKPNALFPFLPAAILRFCQEFPNCDTGLTQTQTNLLNCIAKPAAELAYYKSKLLNPELTETEQQKRQHRYQQVLAETATFRRIFLQLQDIELAPFLGDLSIAVILKQMTRGEQPLLHFEANRDTMAQRYQLTDYAVDLLAGLADQRFQQTDSWRGGCHLTANNCWFWQPQQEQFIHDVL